MQKITRAIHLIINYQLISQSYIADLHVYTSFTTLVNTPITSINLAKTHTHLRQSRCIASAGKGSSFTAVIRVGVECQRAQTSSSQPHLSVGMRPSTPNPSPRGLRRFRPNLSKIYQYDLYWPLSPTLCFCVCFVVSGMQGQMKRPIYGCRFPMHVQQGFIIIVHQVLTHLIHTFTHPITHISPHSHSLGGKDDSHSYLASMAQAKNQH